MFELYTLNMAFVGTLLAFLVYSLIGAVVTLAEVVWRVIDDFDSPMEWWFIKWQSQDELISYEQRPKWLDFTILSVTGKRSCEVKSLRDLSKEQLEEFEKQVKRNCPHWDADLYSENVLNIWYAVGFVFLPLVLWLIINFWAFFCVAGLAIAVLFLARAYRRHVKMFRKHIANPNAHNNQEKKGVKRADGTDDAPRPQDEVK